MKYTMAWIALAFAAPLLAGRNPAAVPEPTSVLLVSAGLAGLVLAARRRKNRK